MLDVEYWAEVVVVEVHVCSIHPTNKSFYHDFRSIYHPPYSPTSPPYFLTAASTLSPTSRAFSLTAPTASDASRPPKWK